MGGQTAAFGEILSTSEVYPWLIDIDVFMTPISQVNWSALNYGTGAGLEIAHNGRVSSSGAQNAEINFDVVLGIGTWTFELLHHADSNRGIYTVTWGASSVGTIDGYNVLGFTPNQRSAITGFAAPENGMRRLKLKMATQNASSSSYFGDISHIQLRRTA